MNPIRTRRAAAFAGLLAVALGAFGAHALKARLEGPPLELWRTAVLYHLAHAIGLYTLSLRPRFTAFPVWAWLAGILLFSGSLYLYALTHLGWLVALTPFGGACFLAGWLCLALEKTPQS